MIYVIHTAPDGTKSFRSYSGMTTSQASELSGAYPGTFELVEEEVWLAAWQAADAG